MARITKLVSVLMLLVVSLCLVSTVVMLMFGSVRFLRAALQECGRWRCGS